MSPGNRLVLAAFLGTIAATTAAIVAWDVWLASQAPDQELTISWSMALLARSPIAIFALGHASGGLLWGLAAHFWFGMMPPDQWEELKRLRAERAVREPPAP